VIGETAVRPRMTHRELGGGSRANVGAAVPRLLSRELGEVQPPPPQENHRITRERNLPTLASQLRALFSLA
jgi:hypothetical protein